MESNDLTVTMMDIPRVSRVLGATPGPTPLASSQAGRWRASRTSARAQSSSRRRRAREPVRVSVSSARPWRARATLNRASWHVHEHRLRLARRALRTHVAAGRATKQKAALVDVATEAEAARRRRQRRTCRSRRAGSTPERRAFAAELAAAKKWLLAQLNEERVKGPEGSMKVCERASLRCAASARARVPENLSPRLGI